ncbi:R3HC1 protein, partial [Toxostoma redivivum]|nr:R3HC1 protein [Toxostoma redivivum]
PVAALALRSMDGVFLSPSEDEFVGRISAELETFMEQGQHQRVLLFPPLSSRLRYLIHRTVENMELLSSFSVGEGWRRRTVICHSAVRLPSETSSDPKAGTNPARSQRPAQPWGRGGRGGTRPRHPGDTHGDNSRSSVGSGRITRPPRRRQDKALFVARGTRKKENWREREPEGENCPKNSIGHARGKDGGKQQEAEEGDGAGKGSAEHPVCGEKVIPSGNSEHSCGQENRDRDCSHCHSQPPAEEPEPSHASSTTAEFQRQENPASQNSRGEHSDVAEALGRSLDLAAGDTEGTRLEDDCTAELLAEIVGNLTVKDISIERVSVECCSHGEVTEGTLGHVTEIYDFPSSLKTEDLMGMFSDFHESGFKLQWVDDTHALGIFSSLSTASQALGRRYPCLKIRPLIHASKQSKIKALQRPSKHKIPK